jgi:hypothetical protein
VLETREPAVFGAITFNEKTFKRLQHLPEKGGDKERGGRQTKTTLTTGLELAIR